MKRWIGWVLCLVLLLITVGSVGLSATAESAMLGDVNNDGVLDMMDAFQVYRWASDGSVPSEKLTVADVTKDGAVDMADAFLIFIIPVAW